jgi:hypothetical protein
MLSQGADVVEKVLVLLENIRIGWNVFPGTNTQAYSASSSIMKKKL